MTRYEAVIGMEVHAQLVTRSKMFCGCDAEVYGAGPNTHVCPVCLGLPGALPVINRRAVEEAIMVGLALNCPIAETAVFARKNYFYPDLPKSYQISMYDFPLGEEGWIEFDDPESAEGVPKRIGITRVHLEEDTAKLAHAGDHSLVDFNRSGLPLLEIVTEPDIRSAEEARRYLSKLQTLLRYLGVSSGDMEKGAMRCEANVSLRPVETDGLGTKVEVKNLNSFRSVKLALEYEVARQAAALDEGGQVRQVTMGWDERRGRTVEQRSKEESDDYRYFPEPDLPPLHLSRSWVEEIASGMPELPDVKALRFVVDYGLSADDVAVLVEDREVAVYFEAAAGAGRELGVSPKSMANWLMGELFRLLKTASVEPGEARVTPGRLAELVALVERGTITSNSGKAVLAEMFVTGRSGADIVRTQGLAQVSDEGELVEEVEEVLKANPEQVARYRDGKVTLLQWFVGQVMKATRGKANPQLVAALLRERLEE
ncbi:Asp-tRNA(Asn)/Glu-tRNA(Gln) amidotransferase subunit GatB [Chloroflexota bacterium]